MLVVVVCFWKKLSGKNVCDVLSVLICLLVVSVMLLLNV